MNNFFIKQAKSSKKDIFCLSFEGKKYWIKKARATKSSKIHKFFYSFLPFELLITSEVKSPKESLEFEAKKVELLRKYGINVPKIRL